MKSDHKFKEAIDKSQDEEMDQLFGKTTKTTSSKNQAQPSHQFMHDFPDIDDNDDIEHQEQKSFEKIDESPFEFQNDSQN